MSESLGAVKPWPFFAFNPQLLIPPNSRKEMEIDPSIPWLLNWIPGLKPTLVYFRSRSFMLFWGHAMWYKTNFFKFCSLTWHKLKLLVYTSTDSNGEILVKCIPLVTPRKTIYMSSAHQVILRQTTIFNDISPKSSYVM